MPVLHELHDGLPDVFLQLRQGRERSGRLATSTASASGTSCFNWDFSYMNGGIVRNQIRSRYRQWLTHKLASWIDQFDVSGCVGCGRCITWCPVAIDLTEEVAAIRENPSVSRALLVRDLRESLAGAVRRDRGHHAGAGRRGHVPFAVPRRCAPRALSVSAGPIQHALSARRGRDRHQPQRRGNERPAPGIIRFAWRAT